MHYSISELQSIFDPITLARGGDYQARGKVQSVKVTVDGDLVSAEVQGSGGQTYRTVITLSRDARGKLQVGGHCICPMVYNCKHVAAVLLEIPARQSGKTHVPAASDYLVNDWLRRIAQAPPRQAATRTTSKTGCSTCCNCPANPPCAWRCG